MTPGRRLTSTPILIDVRAWVLIGVWFVFDLWGALGTEDGIAYWAHGVGFLAGVLLATLLIKLDVIDMGSDVTVFDLRR